MFTASKAGLVAVTKNGGHISLGMNNSVFIRLSAYYVSHFHNYVSNASMLMNLSNYAFENISLCSHYALIMLSLCSHNTFIVLHLLTKNLRRMCHKPAGFLRNYNWLVTLLKNASVLEAWLSSDLAASQLLDRMQLLKT